MALGTTRCMERILPTRRSSFLMNIHLWLSGIYRRKIRSIRHLEEKERLPWWVSITHPRMSLIIFQSPSLVNTFSMMAESFTSLDKEGKIPLREWIVSSETLCY